MIINEKSRFTKVSTYAHFQIGPDHLGVNTYIEIHEIVLAENESLPKARSDETDSFEEFKFFAIPMNRVVKQMSNAPGAIQYGMTEEEVINQMTNWLKGKTREDVFPKANSN